MQSATIATGTQLDEGQATAEAMSIPEATGPTVTAGMPTFTLGASATTSDAQARGASETSSGLARIVTAAPQSVMLGAAGVVAVAFSL